MKECIINSRAIVISDCTTAVSEKTHKDYMYYDVVCGNYSARLFVKYPHQWNIGDVNTPLYLIITANSTRIISSISFVTTYLNFIIRKSRNRKQTSKQSNNKNYYTDFS